jgi:hypothetical protein
VSVALTHSPADVLRWALVQMGAGADPTELPLGGWPVYCAGEPDAPDHCLTVYDTTPQADGRAMPTGETFQHYGIQVRVRSSTHAEGWAKADLLRRTLDEDVYDEFVRVGAHAYLVKSVSGTQLLTLGRNAPSTSRFVFTINCKVTIRPLS